MLPVTPAVEALLAAWSPTTPVRMADLYSFILQGGEVFRYSGYQVALNAPAPATDTPLFTFNLGPKFKRSQITRKIGVEVGEFEIELYAGLDDALAIGSNLSWQEALWAGLFDGAYCRVWRAYLADPFTTVVGTSTLFYGRIGDVEIGRTKTIIRVKSLLDLLTTQMPKRLFQSACSFDFGDARCGYDRVNGISGLGITTGIGQVLINCLPGSDQNSILTSFAPTPSTAYDNGSIVGTSGLNTGFTRTIGQLSGGTIYYLKPWIFPVAAGDGFQLLPGCPHTLAYCTSPLQNQLADGTAGKYGGFPYIPPPETAV